MRVLVVEDEHRAASAICQALVEESFSVDLAHDGSPALELTEQYQHDAIVLELDAAWTRRSHGVPTRAAGPCGHADPDIEE